MVCKARMNLMFVRAFSWLSRLRIVMLAALPLRRHYPK